MGNPAVFFCVEGGRRASWRRLWGRPDEKNCHRFHYANHSDEPLGAGIVFSRGFHDSWVSSPLRNKWIYDNSFRPVDHSTLPALPFWVFHNKRAGISGVGSGRCVLGESLDAVKSWRLWAKLRSDCCGEIIYVKIKERKYNQKITWHRNERKFKKI